tara:strand:- start:615 stop:749 length:135 start_codon:yes stop_codon:yes gene_type:complete
MYETTVNVAPKSAVQFAKEQAPTPLELLLQMIISPSYLAIKPCL